MDIRNFFNKSQAKSVNSSEDKMSDDSDVEEIKPLKRHRVISSESDSEVKDSKKQKTRKIPAKSASNVDEKMFKKLTMKDSTLIPNVNVQRNELWVDKYKPTSINKILGQQGAKSPLSKLIDWLNHWNDDKFKAALISGPPGIGKTTTAHLVCKHLGYDITDLNSSDSRSKNMLKDGLCNASGSFAIVQGQSNIQKSCIIMDEVDGMTGNEDRGGVQELISIIKNSKVPIICICNDRQHIKIRSLANHCLDLRFQRLRAEQIKSCILTITCREKRKLENDTIDQIISGSNGDLRQAIHTLHLLLSSAEPQTCSSKENLSLNLFELCRQVFLPNTPGKDQRSLTDRADIFFTDYSMMPLFVQENYTHIINEKAGKNVLCGELVTSAFYISIADILTNSMRSLNNWSLLRSISMLSTAIPCHLNPGYMSGMINFPSWLGRQSKHNRIQRQLDEAYNHYRLKSLISRNEFRLHVANPLLTMIYKPIIRNGANGIKEACALAQSALLLKNDIDYIAECMDFQIPIDSKLKSAFTKNMNQTHILYPYNLRERKLQSKAFVEGDSDENLSNSDETSANDFRTDKAIKKRDVKIKRRGRKRRNRS